MSEWSAEVELLTLIAERIAEHAQVSAVVGGGKARKIPPLPRPGSAVDRVRQRRREQRHRSLVARLLPKAGAAQDQPEGG